MRRIIVVAISLLIGVNVGAETIIDTTPSWDGINSVGAFGEGSTDTYGQTFTVTGTDVVLTSFTFWIDDRLNPAPVDFAAYVMEWEDGVGLQPSHAVGDILYQSGEQVTSNNGGIDGMEMFTFDTGGITLTPGTKYVAFLNSSLFWDGVNSSSDVGVIPAGIDSYGGGEFVLQATGNNFVPLITEGGWNVTTQDLAFTANFSPVPIPGAIWLFGSGLIGLIGLARCKG